MRRVLAVPAGERRVFAIDGLIEARLARDEHVHEEARPTRLLGPHEWNTEQIAVLLHQARVYRRILKDFFRDQRES